jgi:hypothetical protein
MEVVQEATGVELHLFQWQTQHVGYEPCAPEPSTPSRSRER